MNKTFSIFSIVILCMIGLIACSHDANNAGPNQGEDIANEDGDARGADLSYEAKSDPNLTANLSIWSIVPSEFDQIIPAFNKHYPNVKVDVASLGFEVTPKTLTAIAAGSGGPDIVQFHYNDYDQYNGQAGLEDLLQPPYNAGRYMNDFTEANWNRWLSVDGTKLLAIPQEHIPTMTFYRTDVFEDYGYPTDPEEVAEYLESTDNYIGMAQTLKEDDKWIVELENDAIVEFIGDQGFFDADLNYTRNTDSYIKYFDLEKQIRQLGLSSNLMIVWNPDANQALNSGKLVMITADAMFSSFMKQETPDPAGKWRATRLPFGDYAAGQGLTTAILSQSKNKEAAWAFIEFMNLTLEGQQILLDSNAIHLPGFKPAWKLPQITEFREDYLAGQEVKMMALQLLEKAPMSKSTPLDAKADKIWWEGFSEMLDKNMDSRAALQKIQEDIEAAVKTDKDELLKAIGIPK